MGLVLPEGINFHFFGHLFFGINRDHSDLSHTVTHVAGDNIGTIRLTNGCPLVHVYFFCLLFFGACASHCLDLFLINYILPYSSN